MAEVQVTAGQWWQMFQALGWSQSLAQDSWNRLGGGISLSLRQEQLQGLSQDLGWSPDHAQMLWMILGHLKSPNPATDTLEPSRQNPSMVEPPLMDFSGRPAPMKKFKKGKIYPATKPRGKLFGLWVLVGLALAHLLQLGTLWSLSRIGGLAQGGFGGLLPGRSEKTMTKIADIIQGILDPVYALDNLFRGQKLDQVLYAALIVLAILYSTAFLDRIMVFLVSGWRSRRSLFLLAEILSIALSTLLAWSIPTLRGNLWLLQKPWWYNGEVHYGGLALSPRSIVNLLLTWMLVMLWVWYSQRRQSQ